MTATKRADIVAAWLILGGAFGIGGTSLTSVVAPEAIGVPDLLLSLGFSLLSIAGGAQVLRFRRCEVAIVAQGLQLVQYKAPHLFFKFVAGPVLGILVSPRGCKMEFGGGGKAVITSGATPATGAEVAVGFGFDFTRAGEQPVWAMLNLAALVGLAWLVWFRSAQRSVQSSPPAV